MNSEGFVQHCRNKAISSFPRVTFEALLLWAAIERGEKLLTAAEMQKTHRRLNRAAVRHGWPLDPSDPVDAIGDICFLMLEKKSTLVAATRELVRVQEMGDRFVTSRQVRERSHAFFSRELPPWFQQQFGQDTHSTADHERNAKASNIMTLEDAYRVLGITSSTPADEVKRAYHARIAQWHPDRLEGMAPELKKMATEQMTRINAAYEIVGKSRSRAASS